MCHQKGDFFVRKKVLSLLLAFCMIVAPFTVVQVAAAEPTKVQDSGNLRTALARDGLIQLESDISTKDQSDDFGRLVVTASDVVLDLNGHKLTTEQIEIKPGASLTIQDSSDDETGIVLGTGKSHLILVWPAQNSTSAASFTLESGTVQTPNNTVSNIHTIYTSGTVEIKGGSVIAEGSVSAAIYVNGYNEKFIDPSDPNPFIPVANQVSCTLSGDASIQSKVYGVCLFGEGPDSNGAYDYDKVKLYILEDASIKVSGTDPNDVDGGGQGIATNSSGDKYAGFTIEMSDGSIDAGTHGCGMYLPAIGKTTVTGGSVYGGNQGIRIAAGELTVSGDAVIQNNEARKKSDNDLVNGGSGGTAGAIVVGKASSAYKGGLQINIEGGTIENKATGNADAIVVSDKNMAHSNFQNQSLAVTVTGGKITGNVYCISNLDTTTTTTQDGGKSSITLKGENVQVTGDVENASHSPLLIAEGANVNGDAKKTGTDEGCAVVIDNATVSGDTSTATNLGTVEDGKILSTNGKTYTDLAKALSELPAGGTLYLGKGTFQLSSAVTIDKSVTLRGQGAESTIIQGVSNKPTVYFTVTKGNVVFDGMAFEDFGGNHRVGSGTAVIKVPSGSDVNTNLTVKNAVFENFNRAAIDIEAGKYAISGCSIDCNNEYSETSEQGVLTKGIKIGYGITEASGTIDNVQISSSASTYKKWSASAIEVYQNGSAVITNTEINDCLTGIWVDSYYNAQNNSGNTGTSAYVELGENVNISPKEGGDALIVAHQAKEGLRSSVHITDGEYDGPVYIIEYTPNGETEYAENTEDNFIRISGGRFHNLTPEGMGEDISYIADGYHMDSNGNIKKDTSSPSSSSSSDDPGSALPLAPGASYQPGEPSDSTQPGASGGFVSDTTNDLTVNGTYQFRITSLDGTIPFLTADNANFRVEFASQEGNDFFFKIHAQGAAGSTTVVSVNGVRLLTATVGGSATGVISDTTAPFTVKKGETYQFRLTASARPSFAAGSASFTVEYAGQIGSDYFYKVYAAGNVGDGCGFYINGEASPVAVATIA